MAKVYVPILFALALSAQSPASFQSPYSLDQMKGKQAVVDTDLGTFVIQLLPERAPNHVGHFMKLARDGSYVDTIFHRVIRYGLIQGGDPLSKDPAKATQYGTGGLNELKAEPNPEKHTAGAVSSETSHRTISTWLPPSRSVATRSSAAAPGADRPSRARRRAPFAARNSASESPSAPSPPVIT